MGVQGLSGFGSSFHISGPASPLFSLDVSADQLHLLTLSFSFSFSLLRPSRPQTGRYSFLAQGQPISWLNTWIWPSGSRLFDCPCCFPSVLISICGAMWPKWFPAPIVLWGPGVCVSENTDLGISVISKCHIPLWERGRIPVSHDCCVGSLRKPCSQGWVHKRCSIKCSYDYYVL